MERDERELFEYYKANMIHYATLLGVIRHEYGKAFGIVSSHISEEDMIKAMADRVSNIANRLKNSLATVDLLKERLIGLPNMDGR